jgi:hypothetical protein
MTTATDTGRDTLARIRMHKIRDLAATYYTAYTVSCAARDEVIKILAPMVPDGYHVHWPHGSHSLLARDGASGDWLVLCNAHGTTTPARNVREGEARGTKARRQAWCPQCKATAAGSQS